MNHPLDIAFWDYDRTRALVDGSVEIDAADARFHGGRIVTEIFEKMVRDRAYDVSELGMTYFLRTMELHPEVVRAVYRGFCAAKGVAVERLVRGMTFDNMQTMIPWLSKLLDDDRETLGPDWWPYGMSSNRDALQAILRYHHEQGITAREFAVDDVFVDCLIDT